MKVSTTEKYSHFLSALFALLVQRKTFSKTDIVKEHQLKGSIFTVCFDLEILQRVPKTRDYPMGFKFNEERISEYKWGAKYAFFELAKIVHTECNKRANAGRRFPLVPTQVSLTKMNEVATDLLADYNMPVFVPADATPQSMLVPQMTRVDDVLQPTHPMVALRKHLEEDNWNIKSTPPTPPSTHDEKSIVLKMDKSTARALLLLLEANQISEFQSVKDRITEDLFDQLF